MANRQFSDYLGTTIKKYPTQGVSSAYNPDGTLKVVQPANIPTTQFGAINTGGVSAGPIITPKTISLTASKTGPTIGSTSQNLPIGATEMPKTIEDTSKDVAASFGGISDIEVPEQKTKSPTDIAMEQYTELAKQMQYQYGITTKNTLAQRDSVISQIEAKGVADRQMLRASYDIAEGKINRALSLLGSEFGISKDKVQEIIDSQASLAMNFQANLTELVANEQAAIANADLTAASSLASQQRDMLDFMASMIGKQLEVAKSEQDSAISQIDKLIDNGGLANVDDATLIRLAKASGYDIYALNSMREAVRSGNEAAIAKANLEMLKTQAEIEKTQAETAKVPYEIEYTKMSILEKQANIIKTQAEATKINYETGEAVGGTENDKIAAYASALYDGSMVMKDIPDKYQALAFDYLQNNKEAFMAKSLVDTIVGIRNTMKEDGSVIVDEVTDIDGNVTDYVYGTKDQLIENLIKRYNQLDPNDIKNTVDSAIPNIEIEKKQSGIFNSSFFNALFGGLKF